MNENRKQFTCTFSYLKKLLGQLLTKLFLSLSVAVQPVLAVEDVAAAGPGAEAARDPGAATITAAPGPVPTPDPGPGPSLSPNPEPPGGASQSRPPDLGPVPGPSQGVEPQLPTEGRSRSPGPGPGPNPRVDLNPQGTPEQSLNPNVDAT